MEARPIPYAITDQQAITRLTALWALNESGLGGLLFGLGLPVTGFLVGGFAVILIGLIAWYSNRSYKDILQAMFLVLMVKAAVSPHSPPPAYLAVLFQGFAGALVYSSIRSFKIASIVLAVLAMAESALQKILIVTLIFGGNIWKAINTAAGQLFATGNNNFSWWLIGFYLLLYVFWGFLIGRFTARLPALIHRNASPVMEQYQREQYQFELLRTKEKPGAGKYLKWLWLSVILLFILVVFYTSHGVDRPGIVHVLLRTMAAVLLLFFVLQPLVNRLLRNWLQKRSRPAAASIRETMLQLPALKALVQPAYRMARQNSSAYGSFKQFILIMIVVSLYSPHRE